MDLNAYLTAIADLVWDKASEADMPEGDKATLMEAYALLEKPNRSSAENADLAARLTALEAPAFGFAPQTQTTLHEASLELLKVIAGPPRTAAQEPAARLQGTAPLFTPSSTTPLRSIDYFLQMTYGYTLIPGKSIYYRDPNGGTHQVVEKASGLWVEMLADGRLAALSEGTSNVAWKQVLQAKNFGGVDPQLVVQFLRTRFGTSHVDIRMDRGSEVVIEVGDHLYPEEADGETNYFEAKLDAQGNLVWMTGHRYQDSSENLPALGTVIIPQFFDSLREDSQIQAHVRKHQELARAGLQFLSAQATIQQLKYGFHLRPLIHWYQLVLQDERDAPDHAYAEYAPETQSILIDPAEVLETMEYLHNFSVHVARAGMVDENLIAAVTRAQEFSYPADTPPANWRGTPVGQHCLRIQTYASGVLPVLLKIRESAEVIVAGTRPSAIAAEAIRMDLDAPPNPVTGSGAGSGSAPVMMGGQVLAMPVQLLLAPQMGTIQVEGALAVQAQPKLTADAENDDETPVPGSWVTRLIETREYIAQLPLTEARDQLLLEINTILRSKLLQAHFLTWLSRQEPGYAFNAPGIAAALSARTHIALPRTAMPGGTKSVVSAVGARHYLQSTPAGIVRPNVAPPVVH